MDRRDLLEYNKIKETLRRRNEVEAKKKRPVINRDIVKDNDIVRVVGDMDRTFLVLVILLICFGSVMVFSASYAYAFSSKGDSYYFIKRQIVFVAVGLLGMLGIANWISPAFIKKVTNLYFGGVFIALIAVLVFGISEGEAQRWLIIPGTDFGIQPSEFMKLGLVLRLAKYFSDRENILDRNTFKLEPVVRRLGIPFMIVCVVCAMIALEKHFSGVIILFLVGTCVIFAAGGQWKWLAGAGAAFGSIVFAAIMLVPYARQRLDVFRHPEKYSSQSETWQTIQGVNAVGSGGFFGVGFGQSLQKHMFVSQPQNDFIFAIVCEELGFVGAVAMISLFVALIWRGMVIAQNAPDIFSKLTVVGIMSKVAIQTILNIAVVTNTIPNTGISLPFFSYGGSALIPLMAEMGIVLAISRYSYQKKQ